MAKRVGWTADAVLASLLTHQQMRHLVEIADDEARPGLRGLVARDMERDPAWGGVEFQYDLRDRRHHLLVAGLRLAPGVTYTSRHDRFYSGCGMGSDDPTTIRVTFEAAVRVADTTPPETVLDALVGRHASAVIDHPALRDPGLVVTWAGLNGRVGAWDSFGVLLETVEMAVPKA